MAKLILDSALFEDDLKISEAGSRKKNLCVKKIQVADEDGEEKSGL